MWSLNWSFWYGIGVFRLMVNQNLFLWEFEIFHCENWNYESFYGGLGRVLWDFLGCCWTCLNLCGECLRFFQTRRWRRIVLFFGRFSNPHCFVFSGCTLCFYQDEKHNCSILHRGLWREWTFFVCIFYRFWFLVAISVFCSKNNRDLWRDALFRDCNWYIFLSFKKKAFAY